MKCLFCCSKFWRLISSGVNFKGKHVLRVLNKLVDVRRQVKNVRVFLCKSVSMLEIIIAAEIITKNIIVFIVKLFQATISYLSRSSMKSNNGIL